MRTVIFAIENIRASFGSTQITIFANILIEKKNILILSILLIILFISHFPFLEADPARSISFSRGPFTDEGLNTSQLRNFINHKYLDLTECDNLLKTPLFNSVLYFPLLIFGTGHLIARLTILISTLLLLMSYGEQKHLMNIAIVLVLTTFTQANIFQFTHFSLAEMLCVSFVLAAIAFYYRSRISCGNNSKKKIHILVAAIFITASFLAKIQFAYLLIFFPLALLIEIILFKTPVKKTVPFIAITSMMSVAVLVLFLLFIYLPFREEFAKVLLYQSGGFEISTNLWEYLKFNLILYA